MVCLPAEGTNPIYLAAVRPLFRFPTSRNFTNKLMASGGIWLFLKFSQELWRRVGAGGKEDLETGLGLHDGGSFSRH